LQGFPILHQRLDRVGVDGPGKSFVFTFPTLNHRQGHKGFGKVGIHVNHLHRFGFGLLLGCMCRMPLLPQELCSTQEEPGAHLPAYHVGPLVNQKRKVAIRLNPPLVGVPDNGFGGGPDNILLFESGIFIYHNAFSFGIIF